MTSISVRMATWRNKTFQFGTLTIYIKFKNIQRKAKKSLFDTNLFESDVAQTITIIGELYWELLTTYFGLKWIIFNPMTFGLNSSTLSAL